MNEARDKCEECDGTGKWPDYDGTTVLDCDSCDGTGYVAPSQEEEPETVVAP